MADATCATIENPSNVGLPQSEPSVANREGDVKSKEEVASGNQRKPKPRSFNKQYTGKHRYIARDKKVGDLEKSYTHDQTKARHGPRRRRPKTEESVGEVQAAGSISRSDVGEKGCVVVESSVTSTVVDVSKKRVPRKFQRKNVSREGAGNSQNSGASCGRDGGGHVGRKADQEVDFKESLGDKSHPKVLPKSEKVYRKESSTIPHYTKPSASNGIVSDGVYVRKGRPRYEQPNVRKKQWMRDGQISKGSCDNYSIDNKIASSKTPGPVDFITKNVKQPDSYGRKIYTSYKETRCFDVGPSSIQASVLIEQLTSERYECMVCCEQIRCSKAVWCCPGCYHIFHLFCIKRWARSPAAFVESKY